MRRLIAVTLVFGLLGWGQGAGAAPQPGKQGIGTIIVRIGPVEVLKRGENSWNSAQKGMLLFEGDRVKTQAAARAAILLNDGSVTRLNENTDLVLAVRSTESKKNRMKLLMGNLWARILHQDPGLEIETPSAVAAIKGTELELKVGPTGDSLLIVWDGLVLFLNQKGEVSVRSGQQSNALPGQAPGGAVKAVVDPIQPWFNTVVESPASRTLRAIVKDKDGQEQQLNLIYRKK